MDKKRKDFPVAFVVAQNGKESSCKAGDQGSIPQLARSPGQGKATPSSILAWRIPWTEEPVELQSMGSKGGRHDTLTLTQLSSEKGT